MRFLVVCRPAEAVTAAQMAPHGEAELQALRALRNSGELVEWYSPGHPGAVLVFEAAHAAHLHDSLERLPMRRAGLITTEVIPLHPLDIGDTNPPR